MVWVRLCVNNLPIYIFNDPDFTFNQDESMIRLPADSPKRIIKQMSTYNKSQTTRTLEIFHKCLCVSEEKPNKHVRTLNCKQHLSICHLKICLPGLNFTVSSEFPINQSESNKKCSELSEFHK